MDLSMKKIVVLTGAGISAESGLKTFRDSDGLWVSRRRIASDCKGGEPHRWVSNCSVERARTDHILGDEAELDVPVTAGPVQQVERLLFADLAQRHEDADGHPDPAVGGKCHA